MNGPAGRLICAFPQAAHLRSIRLSGRLHSIMGPGGGQDRLPVFSGERAQKAALPIWEGRLWVGLDPLVGDEGQQSDLTSPLDGLGQLTLMHGAGAGGAAGQDLGALGHETTQLGGVLVINGLALVRAELADLAALTAVHGTRRFFVSRAPLWE